MARELPQTFTDVGELSTSTNGVMVLYGRRADGSLVAVEVDADGKLSTNAAVTIPPGDIQIGAVEIKDADADIRQKVKADAKGEIHRV